MAYCGSNDDVIDDVMWPWKVKVVIPISFMPVISIFRKRLDIETQFNGAPSPSPTLHKSCTKFTWRIYALSERLLVKSAVIFH